MAQAYAMKGDIPNMEKYGNKALSIYPEMHVCMYLMAQGYQNAKMFDKAIEKLNNVLVTRPKEAQAYYMRSICKANNNGMNDALLDIKKSIELQPFNDQFYGVAVQLFNAVGQTTESQRYQNALKDVYVRDEIYQELTGGDHLQGFEDL
jgi:tetratricopeptide (TPR) repeat protein